MLSSKQYKNLKNIIIGLQVNDTWWTYLRIMSAQFLDNLRYLHIVAYTSAGIRTHAHTHINKNTAILCFTMPVIINAEISPYSQVIKWKTCTHNKENCY